MAAFYRFAGRVLPALAGSALLSASFTSGCNGTGASTQTFQQINSDDDSGTPTSKDAGNPTTGGDTGTPMSGEDTGTPMSGEDTGTPMPGDDAGDVGDTGSAADTGTITPVPDSGAPPTSWGTPVAGGPMGTGVAATVTVNPGSTVGTITTGFAGLSYEKTHITNDSLNSTNASLIALYKLIGSPVVRLGADDVENCHWSGAGAAPPAPSGQPFTFGITTGMVDELCSFLAATGSKIIYGVNFKSDNVPASAAEAAYAQGKCGSSIYGFEIGNEINFQGTWVDLKTKWESFATAMVATPGVLLIGPAGAGNGAPSFTTPFAAAESEKFGSKLTLLTEHYYAGSAGTSSATPGRLETPDPYAPTDPSGLVNITTTMGAAVAADKIPNGYRMGECNTDAHHGQMGVSDTLVAGLWSLDMMFVTAEHGGGGVNFHGGELGMDGTVPFYYEPIMEHNGAVVGVQPLYYGMLLFYLAGQGPMVSTTATTSNPNFTAYAIKTGGWTSVVLDNKNPTSGVNATVNLGAAVSSASAIYLQGTPVGDVTASAADVTLAGAPISAAGVWNRKAPFIQTTSGNTVSVYVPPASAALVRVLQ